jgi:serine/threonine protein kinase
MTKYMVVPRSTGTFVGPAGVFDLTGSTLGKYRIIERIGRGGTAQVYKAYQADLDRYVAIKILHPHLTDDEDFAAGDDDLILRLDLEQLVINLLIGWDGV